MKSKDIRALSVQEIAAKTDDLRHELMNLRFRQVAGQLTDTSQLRTLRRRIARMETILNEKKRLAE
jgi:large subunit ribosomal protein L29